MKYWAIPWLCLEWAHWTSWFQQDQPALWFQQRGISAPCVSVHETCAEAENCVHGNHTDTLRLPFPLVTHSRLTHYLKQGNQSRQPESLADFLIQIVIFYTLHSLRLNRELSTPLCYTLTLSLRLRILKYPRLWCCDVINAHSHNW